MRYLEYISKQKLIDSDIEIFGGVETNIIEQAERRLNVFFPNEYISFLKECGSCGYPDSYISGLFRDWNNEESTGSTLHDTLSARKQHGLPNDYIVLEYAVEDNYYLLKVSKEKRLLDAEVYSVDIDSDENLSKFNRVFDSFEEYFRFTFEIE